MLEKILKVMNLKVKMLKCDLFEYDKFDFKYDYYLMEETISNLHFMKIIPFKEYSKIMTILENKYKRFTK